MSKDKLAQVFHFDLYGKREDKYDFLNENALDSIEWEKLALDEPSYFFVKKNFDESGKYEKGFLLGDLFTLNITGVKTHDDNNLVSFTSFSENNFAYDYRPFDIRNINYDLKKVVRHRFSVMKHMLNQNLSLIIPRQAVTENWNHVGISKNLSDNRIHYSNKGIPIVCPLYLYPETKTQLSIGESLNRTPNLNAEIVQKIASGLGLTFVAEKNASTPLSVTNISSPNVSLSGVEDNVSLNKVAESSSTYGNARQAPSPSKKAGDEASFSPIDLLDYIYAVLHSPAYRKKYKEFLKIDFPRVPYPTDAANFWQLVKLGSEIRQIHLLESPETENYITQYPIDGNNVVEKIRYQLYDYNNTLLGEDNPDYLGAVYINDTQYFADVPISAWEFYIGGYQPAQKWLKDRKGRSLQFEDILHYQKIIVALKRTAELMLEIDGVLEV